MALSLEVLARRARHAGAAKPCRLASVALAAALAAGCGDDAADPSSPAPVVAGESYGTRVSKPLAVVAATASSTPRYTNAASVPAIAGKIRYGIPIAAHQGVGTTLAGAVPFPIVDAWNEDVSRAAVDPASDTLVAAIGAQASLRPGFGALAGVPYAIVDRTQPRVTVRIAGTDATRQWPIPAALSPSADAAARVVVLDRDAGLLHELRGAARRPDGTWDAASGASWRLDLADAPPVDTVPAGAAPDGGLPLFPGLVRRDEADAGAIHHALRITVPAVRGAWLPPARAAVDGPPDTTLPPIGLRLRLKPGTSLPADASPQARAVLRALKTYGAIVVGVGPALTLDGAPDAGWDVARLAADLARIRGEDFEAVAMDGLVATR